VLAAAASPVAASAAGAPAISVGEPAGFGDLTAKQTLLVDVYFGGVRKGEATVVATPDAVTISDPSALVRLLPQVADSASVTAALAAPNLPANSAQACSAASDRATCGRLSPAVAGVILDRDKLRLDVFLNPRLLAVQDNVEQRYLPAPPGGVTMVNPIGAVLAGRFGGGDNSYNLQDQAVLADGSRRLRADLSYANGYGLTAERVAVEWDRPERRYSAGALWAPGNDLTGRRKLIGAGIETQIDTRLDKDELIGSPLVVYLDQRARVDVMRDGRVLNSAIYEAGNQQLDTSNRPDGSYEVVLRIAEPGRPTREERRFFAKSRRIPSLGRTDFFAFAGLQVDGFDPGALAPSRHPLFEGGVARRLSAGWAVDGSVQASDRGASAEMAATLLTRFAQVRAAAVADLGGRYGAILQVMSGGFGRLNFNLDLRHIESRSASTAATPTPADPFAAPDLARLGSYSQASGIVSYGTANLRFLGAFSYRDEPHAQASYSVGPSVEWDVIRKGPITLTMHGDVAATDRGASEFAGLSLRLVRGRSSLSSLAGARHSTIHDDEVGSGPVASIAGSLGTEAAGGQLEVGAGYDHQPNQDAMVLTTEFRQPLGTLTGDFVRDAGNGPAEGQYSLGLQTTIATGGGGVRVAGKTTTGSMIIAQVEGAHDADSFEVLVDDQVAGTIVGNRPLALALPTYRAYQVRIRPTGKDLLAYDSAPRSIGLYPGAVTRLEWKVAPLTIKFGRLVAPDGTPLAHASITGKGVWGETDDGGNFQIEAPDNADLTVTLSNGRSFTMTLPRGEVKDGMARLGAVHRPAAAAELALAASPTSNPGPGEPTR
jgi:hypothetical protein